MNFKRFCAMSILAATCAFTFSDVSAQSLTRDSGPAETPPASFVGNQYVDSKGCVYIRAGVDGNTNWVPRVSRARTVVCGMTPSLGAGAGSAVAAAPSTAEPVQIGAASVTPTAPAPAARNVAVRPTRNTVASVLAPSPVRTVASTPAPRVRAPQPMAVRTPRRVQMQSARVQAPVQQIQPRIVRVAPQPTVQMRQAQTNRVRTQTQRAAPNVQTCQGASAISQRYIGGRGMPVRCGPQTGSLVTTRAGDVQGTFRSANGQVMTNVSPNAIVVPRHVYEQQQAARVVAPMPRGYREAWSDDRLNTRRAHQTLGGKAQTDLIWSQTVPRQLIVRSTGRNVTRSFPGLRYPYTSHAQQAASVNQGVQMGTRVVSSQGTTVKRQVRRQPAVQQQQARVSTRSTAPRKPAQAAGKRYVQVGTFGVASNAQNTAARLQSMGLPVRIGNFTRAGKQMRIVLAGPFASPAHTNGALHAVRRAGFRDAFARN